jgi:predicted DNA-binding protein
MATRRERLYTRPIALRLEEDVWEALRALSTALDKTPAALVREWVGERLRIEQEAAQGYRAAGALPDHVEAFAVAQILKSSMASFAASAREAFQSLREQLEQEIHQEYEMAQREAERAEARASA